MCKWCHLCKLYIQVLLVIHPKHWHFCFFFFFSWRASGGIFDSWGEARNKPILTKCLGDEWCPQSPSFHHLLQESSKNSKHIQVLPVTSSANTLWFQFTHDNLAQKPLKEYNPNGQTIHEFLLLRYCCWPLTLSWDIRCMDITIMVVVLSLLLGGMMVVQ